MKGLFFILLIVFTPFSREDPLIFKSSFEYGHTLLANPFKANDSRMVLYAAGDIEKWPDEKGQGFISIKKAPFIQRFTYKKRKNNVLTGISGLAQDCPAFTRVFTAGLAQWEDVHRKHIALHLPGIHGRAGVKISFTEKGGSAYMRTPITPSRECFGRFSILFSKEAITSVQSKQPVWILEAPSETRGTFRIGLKKKDNRLCFCLRFHTNEIHQGKLEKKDIYLYNREAVKHSVPYCVEFHYRGADSVNGGAGFWINDSLADESFGYNTKVRGAPAYLTFGAFSTFLFRAGHIIIDDIIISRKRIGPMPAVSKTGGIFRVQQEITSGQKVWFLPVLSLIVPLAEFNFPVILPDQGQKHLYHRIRVQNTYGSWSDWIYDTKPESLGLVQTLPIQYLKSPVQGINIGSAKRDETARVIPGEWSNISISVSNLQSLRRLKIILSHFRFPEAFRVLENAYLNIKSNYMFYIYPKSSLLWIYKYEGREQMIEVSGQQYKFVDGETFKIDTVKGTATLRVRLSADARPGPWRVQALAEQENKNFLPFFKPFIVQAGQAETGVSMKKWFILVLVLIMGLSGFIFKMIRLRSKPDEEPGHPIDFSMSYVQRSIEIISEKYSDPELDMENVAKKLNISKSHLSHQFKQETGKSFPEYLNELRIEKAKDLLKTTPKRVSEIAFDVGYNSVEHFNASFKKMEKVTPTHFRSKN